MKPSNLNSRIFLDSGDPKEARDAISLLGFLDGQTTNPSLISKNPEAQKRLQEGKKFTKKEVYSFYKGVIQELSGLMPKGSISIEVYADFKTTPEEMLRQSREMHSWIPNAHIKFPTTSAGLTAAGQAVKEGMGVNMTLCFSQEQAAAVDTATRGAKRNQVYVSPFVGRLDDIGQDGMSLIANIIKMYSQGDNHVEVLTASVRTLEHLVCALHMGSDIITAPFKVLKEWADIGMLLPKEDYAYDEKAMMTIPYKNLDLGKNWQEFNLEHELTTKGIEKFALDWNNLVA